MGVFETIGFAWTVLGTGLFTAFMLIAAIWSITLGVKVTLRRYRLGESMERTLEEPEHQRAKR